MRQKYAVRQDLRPSGLAGISEKQIAQHWALYEGYVKNLNALNDTLRAVSAREGYGPEFAALKRRLGFEYNGVILHEHYFGILRPGRRPLGDDAGLAERFRICFGGFEKWKEEFSAMGAMRGVGWVILYFDPVHANLTNHWISSHDEGHPAGGLPLLVMDVWEHSYMVDHGADGRSSYVEAFLQNVDWPQLERAFRTVRRGTTARGSERRHRSVTTS